MVAKALRHFFNISIGMPFVHKMYRAVNINHVSFYRLINQFKSEDYIKGVTDFLPNEYRLIATKKNRIGSFD